MYKSECYKGKYFIAFYDKDGEEFVNCFDSIYQILTYLKRPCTKKEYNIIHTAIYKALKTDTLIYFLDRQPRKVYLIEI